MEASSSKYTKTAVILHWVSAAVMLYMLFFGEDLIRVARGGSLADWPPTAHASWGFVVLLLGVCRILWRMGHQPPALPATMAGWQAKASHITHGFFYAMMIAIPVFGLLALIPYGAERTGVESITFFRLFPLAFMPNLGEWTAQVHELLATITKIVVIIHVAAALKHQFWDKDGLLRRMSPH